MALIKWNPERELMDMEKEFSKMFNSLNRRFGFGDGGDGDGYQNAVWMPLTDIYENNDNFFLKVDLPGINKEDVKINFTDGQLTISGERKQETESKEGKFHRVERSYGKYYRSFTLPKKIQEDKIDAEFKNGQLTVRIPKSEEAKPRELEIKVK
jgi:HSP20 family protein